MKTSVRLGFRNLWTVLWLSLIGLAVRIYTAGWGGLSHDEALCANIATVATWSQMIDCVVHDGNPPLLYALLRLWSLAFGGTDLSFRIFSVLAATSIVPISYLLFRRQLGRELSLQIAILLAFCAPLVHFGVLVRGYALLSLLSLMATQQLMILLHRVPRRIEQCKYAILIALMVYTHHWGAMVAIGHAVLIMVGALRKWWDPDRIKSWMTAVATAIILYLPWAFILYRQLHADTSPWIEIPTWQECLFYTPVEAVAGYQDSPEWLYSLNALWANLAIWGSLLIPIVVTSRSADLPDFIARRWQVPTASGLAAVFIITQLRSIWRDRYLTAFSPLLLVLYVVICSRLTRRLSPLVAWVLPVLVWLLTWLPQLQQFHQQPESSGWALAEHVSRHINKSKDLVVISFEAIAPQIDRYLPADVPVVSFPDMERVNIMRWEGVDRRIRDEAQFDLLIDRLQHVLANGGNIWLVDGFYDFIPFPRHYPLNECNFHTVETIRECQVRGWLGKHATTDPGDDFCAPGREFSIRTTCFRQTR